MKKAVLFFWTIVFLMFFASNNNFANHKSSKAVQIAILLDTSGSMDGLIEQAKSQLWKIVNELARAKKEGESSEIFVGLYEYGKSDIPASEGYLRMISPLTSDLDKISDELFKLKTNGGYEYCGKVIKSAVKELKWSSNNEDLKIIIIAGNEPFTQGEVDYKEACKLAISKGIIVNTIYCGSYEEGVAGKWKEGADLADGKYMNIDHNAEIEFVETPYDEEILQLGAKINQTYMPYGSYGFEKKAMQETQDLNALGAGKTSAVERSITKGSVQYRNSAWDLVDAVKNENVKIEDLKDEDLPDVLKKKNLAERKLYIDNLSKQRADIQKKLSELEKNRRSFIDKQYDNKSKNTFDEAMLRAVQEQAKKKNFKFD